jgi:hypothetical protein
VTLKNFRQTLENFQNFNHYLYPKVQSVGHQLYQKLIVNLINICTIFFPKKIESKISTFPQVVAEVLKMKGGRVDAKTSGLVLSNHAEDGGEAPIENLNPGPSMNVLTSKPPQVGIIRGNPGVFQLYPGPIPCKPLPPIRGKAFVGWGKGF